MASDTDYDLRFGSHRNRTLGKGIAMQITENITHTYKTFAAWARKAVAFTLKWMIRAALLTVVIGLVAWVLAPLETGGGPRSRWDIAQVYANEWQSMTDKCKGENIKAALSIPFFFGITILNSAPAMPAFALALFDKHAAVVAKAARQKIADDFYAVWWGTTRVLFFKKPCGFTRPENLTKADFQ